jgi:hypothetical protein
MASSEIAGGLWGNSTSRGPHRAHIATIAYLEVNRDAIKGTSLWSWPFKKRQRTLQPIDAEFKEVAESPEPVLKKPGKSVRVIK